MKILTLKEISNNLQRTIIGFDFEKLKKELYDYENHEYTEIINNLPKKVDDNIDMDNKINSKISLNQTENNYKATTINNEEDSLNKHINEGLDVNANIIQYKYRKLFLIKKVYDSLDDEEIGDEEDINACYLLPTSFKVYIIDFFVLITSLIELFYLPFYLAYYSHRCRNHFLSIKALLFYISDNIYY